MVRVNTQSSFITHWVGLLQRASGGQQIFLLPLLQSYSFPVIFYHAARETETEEMVMVLYQIWKKFLGCSLAPKKTPNSLFRNTKPSIPFLPCLLKLPTKLTKIPHTDLLHLPGEPGVFTILCQTDTPFPHPSSTWQYLTPSLVPALLWVTVSYSTALPLISQY